ncbi:MAG: ribonuclease J, partial [Microgenomates group bacterium Gr01-1014_93]
NEQTGKLEANPDIISRGFVFEEEAGDLLNLAKQVVIDTMGIRGGKISDWKGIRREIEIALDKFLYEATERRPLILPVIVEV